MRRALAWLLLWGITGAEPVFAQEFARLRTKGSQTCVWWESRDFVYHQDTAGSLRTPGDAEFGAIDSSFQAWQSVSNACSDFKITRGEDVTQGRIEYFTDGRANQNVVLFREVSCSDVVPPDDPCYVADTCGNEYHCWEHELGIYAKTFSAASDLTGRLIDTDIEINAASLGSAPGFLYTTVDGPVCGGEPASNCVSVDIRNTMTHEIGHALGFAHVGNAESTMFGSAPLGELSKRLIDVGSATGFCTIYPRGKAVAECNYALEGSLRIKAVNNGSSFMSTGCGLAPGAVWPWAVLSLLGLARRRRQK